MYQLPSRTPTVNRSSLNNMIPPSYQSFEEEIVVANTSLQTSHTSQTNESDDYATKLDAIIAVVNSVQMTDTDNIEQLANLVIQGSSEQQLPVVIKEPETVLPERQSGSSTYNLPKELQINVQSAPKVLENSLPRKDAAGKSSRKATKREPKSAASKSPSLVAMERNAEKNAYPMTPSNKLAVAESIPTKGPIVNTAIEAGGDTKVAEEVVHLVPVENADGTITYMLLSLGSQGELRVDEVKGTALTIEEGAIYMDKTTDADTFFASITQPNVSTSVSENVTQPFMENVCGATYSNANNQLQGVQTMQSNQPSNELIQITQQVDGGSSGSRIKIAAGSSEATHTIASATPSMLDLASIGLIAETGETQILSREQQFAFLTEDGSIINISDFMKSSRKK